MLVQFVFLMGVFVSSLAGYGIYSHNREIREEFEKKRSSKLSYRTNEEFIG